MKFLKKLSIVVVALIAIYVILAFIGPSNYKLERSIKIGSAIENVYNQTSIYANWADWSPWAKADPEAQYTIEKDDQTIGSSLGWKGELSGTGSMTTSEITANEKFMYKLVFTEPWYMAMTSNGGFTYKQDGDSVILSWFDEGDFGFMSRPMMLFMSMEEQIGPQFEMGLSAIKEICENMPDPGPEVEIVEMEVEAQAMFYVEESSELNSEVIGGKIGAAYGEIGGLLAANGIEMVGMPITITNSFSMKEMSWVFDCALRVESTDGVELTGRVKTGTTYAGKVVRGTHVGSYEESVATYNAISKYMEEKGLTQEGRSWEEYIDDPEVVAPEELRTYIYFPVK